MCCPDHRLVPVLTELWDGRVLAHHQRQRPVQTGERDAHLYHSTLWEHSFTLKGKERMCVCVWWTINSFIAAKGDPLVEDYTKPNVSTKEPFHETLSRPSTQMQHIPPPPPLSITLADSSWNTWIANPAPGAVTPCPFPLPDCASDGNRTRVDLLSVAAPLLNIVPEPLHSCQATVHSWLLSVYSVRQGDGVAILILWFSVRGHGSLTASSPIRPLILWEGWWANRFHSRGRVSWV